MSEAKSRHYLFSIHGIGASKEIFAFLGPSLEAHWDGTQSELHYLPFDYHTGKDELTTFDFAQSFHQFVLGIFEKNPLRAKDRVSLVLHSQGGLIGLIWLYNLYKFQHPLLKNIDAFISLATPFWGSKMAEVGSEIRKLWEITKRPFFLPTGKHELDEMSFLSDTNYFFRQLFSDDDYQGFREYFSKLRVLNMAAYSVMLGGLNLVVGEAGIYESDRAVSLPSAHLDFYFLRNLNFEYQEDERIDLQQLKCTNLAPYIIVKAVHHTYAPNDNTIPGIAQIPKECISENYQHPSFGIIKQHLLGQMTYPYPLVFPHPFELKFFFIDFNIHLEDATHIDIKDIAINFTQLNQDKIKWSEITIGWFLRNSPDFKKRSTLYPEQYRLHFQGQIKTAADNYMILATISAPDHKRRQVELMVRPSYSTYIDIALAKK